MSGIQKRTIYVTPIPYVNGNVNGSKVLRFSDMAVVVTGCGACIEPFTINDKIHFGSMGASVDPKDMMRRVDEISSSSVSGELALFSAGEPMPLHDYTQWLRVGP